MDKASPQCSTCFESSWIIVNELVSVSALAQDEAKEEKDGCDGRNGTVHKVNHEKQNHLRKGLGVPKVRWFLE